MTTPNSIKSVLRAILPAAIVFSNTATADFNYSFFEASYMQDKSSFETNAIDDFESNGYSLKFGYAFNGNIAVGGEFKTLEGDSVANFQQGGRTAINIDGTAMSATALYHRAFNDQTDLLVGGKYSKADVETTRPDGVVAQLTEKKDATFAFAGARFKFAKQIELEGKVIYQLDTDDDEDEFSYVLEGRFEVQPSLTIGGRFEPDDSGDTLSVNLRKYFL